MFYEGLLDRPIVPKVQEIMVLRSSQAGLAVLTSVTESYGGRQFASIYEDVQALTNEYHRLKEITTLCTQLKQLGILDTKRRGIYDMTELGRESMTALNSYRDMLIEPYLEVTPEKNIDEITLVEQIPPPILDILRLQSFRESLLLTLAIAKTTSDTPSLGELKKLLEDEEGRKINMEAIRKWLNSLKNKNLVSKPEKPDSGIALTSLGAASIAAYNMYQESLFPVLD